MSVCKVLFILLTLTLPLWAQSSDDLLRAYRSSWSGDPLSAELFQRYVEVKAGPDWWTYLQGNPNGKGKVLVDLADPLLAMGSSSGWGDLRKLDSDTGGTGNAPPLLQALETWRDKLHVNINLPAGLDESAKARTLDNLWMIYSPINNNYVCLPRAGKFFLNLSFDAKAKQPGGKVSKDGSTYDLVLPIYETVYTMPLETFFQKGKK